MKKFNKRIWAILITISILLVSIIPMNVLAADTPVRLESSKFAVWADPENILSQDNITDFTSNNNKLATLGGIQPFKRATSSTDYYLFLPSTADLTALKLWFSGTLTIDGKTVTSGEPTDIFKDINEGGVSKKVTFKLGSGSYNVTVLKSGDVGTVYVDTTSGSLSKVYSSSSHTVGEAGTIMVVQPDGTVDYCGEMLKIQGRGNGTWSTSNAKNPFNVKLAKSTSLLGMNAAKKWVLLANSVDTTLIKDQLTYDFAKYIGVNYQPICKPVDLYVNQQYYGSYQLSEKVELKSNRINVSDAYDNLEIANGTTDTATGAIIPADLTGTAITNSNAGSGATIGGKRYSSSLKDPSDYTGGYLYELEISQRWVKENAGFCAYNKQGWVLKNCDYASKAMVDYSYDLLFALGSSVYNNGIVPSTSKSFSFSKGTASNPAPAAQYQGKKWSDILDADSAVKYYWTQEFFKNMDSSTTSTYFYKDSDSVDSMLYAGPVWDMDNSCGQAQRSSRWNVSLTSSNDWYTKNTRIYRYNPSDSGMDYSSDSQVPKTFYAALSSNCSDFWNDAERYWFAYISPAVEILSGRAVDKTGVLKSVYDYANTVAKSGYMNNVRHAVNSSKYDADSIANTLKTWFDSRQTWITNQITPTDISKVSIAEIVNQSYTGSEITPSITATINKTNIGTLTLEEGVDYTLSYKNNINAGTATVTITGIGTYTGSVNKTFTIVPADLSNGYTAKISEIAYSNMELSADVIHNETNKSIESNISYQWYRDNVKIDGACEKTYITTAEDIGTVLNAVATGDNKNAVNSVKSNDCTVKAGERPVGYTQTIAAWNYDYTANAEQLASVDENTQVLNYLATGGENQSISTLRASVNATDNTQIKWSGTADLYTNDSNSVLTDQAPVMGTSKTTALAWGEYPYFETVTSTLGYEKIGFSAKLGGTKKAPRDWKLQYSTDGNTYNDVDGAVYSITNNKAMEIAFDNIALPEECNNQNTLYLRMVVYNDIAINGTNTVINQISGDAAVNNIMITGSSLSVVTSLNAPAFNLESNSIIYDDTEVEIKDNNGGADIYYSINGSEPQLYTNALHPFDARKAKVGDTVTITAYAHFDDIQSEIATAVYCFAGVDIISFSYDEYSTDVANGAVSSTGGIYDKSGRMTAYTDGSSQYVPLWNEKNKSFSIAPDDGALWSENAGFTYMISTAGYENINFSCMAYTTAQGPNSVTLQYSTDSVNYYNIKSDITLPANGILEELMVTAALPAACDNQSVLYIRLVTKEDLTNAGNKLHNSVSKGNLYVNNVVVAGEDNTELKMPYTNKSTNYFGENGTVKYVSPDNMPIQYAVFDENNNIVQNGVCPEEGIKLSSVSGFSRTAQAPYTVITWIQDDEDTSAANINTYYYKGDTVVKFNYNSSTKLFENYVSSDWLSVSNTSGVKSGRLSMYPNGSNAALISYTGSYGVKAAWDTNNVFYATKKLDNPKDNGYWLIETSTTDYANLTLNLEQISSNKGPRDWGIAYSTDGKNYTYVKNSNTRVLSNDFATSTVESYSNLPLPSACDNQEKLYIKVFINGGESVDGTELETVLKGNTGINAIEISGIKIPSTYNVTINTVALEDKNGTHSDYSVDTNVTVNGVEYKTTGGTLTLQVTEGETYKIGASVGNTFVNTVSYVPADNAVLTLPVVCLDAVEDGVINAKDYAEIYHSKDEQNKEYYLSIFQEFINAQPDDIKY